MTMQYNFNDLINKTNGYEQRRRKISVMRNDNATDEIKQIEKQRQIELLKEQIDNQNFERSDMNQQRHDSESSIILKME